MELKRIDNLWHFFATQNQLFLKKKTGQEVAYTFVKHNILLTHLFNPRFTSQSVLTIGPESFELAVESQAAGRKRFGLPGQAIKVHQRLFFPRDLLRLTAHFSVTVERDRFRNIRVSLEPFVPQTIIKTYQPVNFISEILWGFRYFSETIKN
ncbi:hypothetical protein [Cyclobacterium xiamenense]|uniref:hypothetical protein n=1 Tax=Cyclobacterium xiamenense TaxID=1297121 RepID=UPI0035D06387